MRLRCTSESLPARHRTLKWALTIAGVLFALSANAEDLKLRYSISVAGVEIYDVSARLSLSENSYKADVLATATGLVGLASGSKIKSSGSGTIAGSKVQPSKFSIRSSTFGSDKKIMVNWSSNGKFRTERNFELSAEIKSALKKAAAKNSKGPLARIVEHMQTSAPKACSGKKRIYTGRAVYDYALTAQGAGNLSIDDGRISTGQAFKCQLTYHRIAGFSSKLISAFVEENPEPVTIWFAPISLGGKALLLPLKAQGSVAGQRAEVLLVR